MAHLHKPRSASRTVVEIAFSAVSSYARKNYKLQRDFLNLNGTPVETDLPADVEYADKVLFDKPDLINLFVKNSY